ncbi:fatty acid desaturase family protein [Streptomyces sp. NPDC002564]|uniref:fatty acid desaturase family protein n=1 Tax=Streptomyces sp. NPDC002564 TaxID=3364649 RepID=UPI00368488B1
MPESAPTAPVRRPGSDFTLLSKRIKAAGLLARRPGYYLTRTSLVLSGYVLAWAAFARVGDSWWNLATAAALAFVFGQVALLAHDVAHLQVFRRRATSARAGRLLGNLGIGMGYGWWQDKHSRHHANPNHEDLDPDVRPDILLWSAGQARRAQGWLPRLVGRRQAYLFFPLLALEGFNLHAAGLRSLADRTLRRRRTEALLLLGHLALYAGALFLTLPAGKAVAFLLVHQCLFGLYLGSVFAPNHKGMPLLAGKDRPDFLRRQVLTSRNVRGGRLTDLMLGGLNYQIEHHLFPQMPTPHLRRAQDIVRAYCRDARVPHAETGLLASYREALRSLHAAGEPLRHPDS